MVYKSLNNLAPSYMRSMFIDRDSLRNYSLRATEGKMAIPKPRTNYLKNSFSYDGAILWNSLPIEIRRAKSLNLFKTGYSGFFKYCKIQDKATSHMLVSEEGSALLARQIIGLCLYIPINYRRQRIGTFPTKTSLPM